MINSLRRLMSSPVVRATVALAVAGWGTAQLMKVHQDLAEAVRALDAQIRNRGELLARIEANVAKGGRPVAGGVAPAPDAGACGDDCGCVDRAAAGAALAGESVNLAVSSPELDVVNGKSSGVPMSAAAAALATPPTS